LCRKCGQTGIVDLLRARSQPSRSLAASRARYAIHLWQRGAELGQNARERALLPAYQARRGRGITGVRPGSGIGRREVGTSNAFPHPAAEIGSLGCCRGRNRSNSPPKRCFPYRRIRRSDEPGPRKYRKIKRPFPPPACRVCPAAAAPPGARLARRRGLPHHGDQPLPRPPAAGDCGGRRHTR
jgi:hypothetical protein